MFHVRSQFKTSLDDSFEQLLHSQWHDKLRLVLLRTAFGVADVNGVHLIASEPSIGARSPGRQGELSFGAESLRQAWMPAHVHGSRELDVAIVCHSINGWADQG